MLMSVYFHLLSLRSALPVVVLTGIFPHVTATQILGITITSILPRGAFFAIDEGVYNFYQSLVAFFFETYCGSKILFYGDELPVDRKENVIFLCNHQSSVDWVISDLIAIRQGSMGSLRYVLKLGLKHLPLYGFTLAQHGCIYVSKQDQNNEERLARKLRAMVEEKRNMWMVIFPEGTRYNTNKKEIIESSQNFARKQGLAVHRHVLVPRSKGVEALVQNLGDYVDAVYDITIAYHNINKPLLPRAEGPSLTEFVAEAGEEVHIHLNRIPAADLPMEREKIQAWLNDLFDKKERLLQHFFDEKNGGKFPGKPRTMPVPLYRTVPHFIFCSGLLLASIATTKNRSMYGKITLALCSGTVIYMNTLFNWLQYN